MSRIAKKASKEPPLSGTDQAISLRIKTMRIELEYPENDGDNAARQAPTRAKKPPAEIQSMPGKPATIFPSKKRQKKRASR